MSPSQFPAFNHEVWDSPYACCLLRDDISPIPSFLQSPGRRHDVIITFLLRSRYLLHPHRLVFAPERRGIEALVTHSRQTLLPWSIRNRVTSPGLHLDFDLRSNVAQERGVYAVVRHKAL